MGRVFVESVQQTAGPIESGDVYETPHKGRGLRSSPVHRERNLWIGIDSSVHHSIEAFHTTPCPPYLGGEVMLGRPSIQHPAPLPCEGEVRWGRVLFLKGVWCCRWFSPSFLEHKSFSLLLLLLVFVTLKLCKEMAVRVVREIAILIILTLFHFPRMLIPIKLMILG